jgi:hypothetical protein
MGKIWRRLAVAASASSFIALSWMPVTTPAGAAPAPLSIGVDNVSPAGHNFEYTDFFPRDNVNVHSGDLVDFNWLPARDGFHTSTLLPTTMTPAQAWAANHLVVPDSSDQAGNLPVFNPAIAGPTHPPAGAPVPGACGSTSTPCTFDGT